VTPAPTIQAQNPADGILLLACLKLILFVFRFGQQLVEFAVGVLEVFYQFIQGAIEDRFVQSLSVRGIGRQVQVYS
jgi:hypothetical protein